MRLLNLLTVLVVLSVSANAAGVLKPVDPADQDIRIRNHHVDVVINNGFARTEVRQTFYNPNGKDLEAVYQFPVPESASLSEISIYIGEKEIKGEVVARQRAGKIYEEQKQQGKDAGLAEKETYKHFRISVSPVRATTTTDVRFVYYQPLTIDAGMGRYVYPLEHGGTDDGQAFWTGNEEVDDRFSLNLVLKSAWPVTAVRVKGLPQAPVAQKIAAGHYRVTAEEQNAKLNRDVVVYYRLKQGLPGRVEVIPYRADRNKAGTFMMIVTPGVDLAPLTGGADYLFVLDVSGSMATKLHTLGAGVAKALARLRQNDRFRIITFADQADELVGWTKATKPNVTDAIAKVKALRQRGSTNMYAGIRMALSKLDADRATSLILVTDAVTNTGQVNPEAFYKLMKKYDVRVFGFLMGNSANWPLMRTIADASGGFYAGISNDDDIVGQIMLAKNKITHACLHDAELKISGGDVHNTTDGVIGKVYNGQQLVIFGRYRRPGQGKVVLKARLTGQDKIYSASFNFPEMDKDNPELERLWAMSRIEKTRLMKSIGRTPAKEADNVIRDLGVQFQLVTDETSMILVDDAEFAKHGIDRKNLRRTQTEAAARAARAAQPIQSYRVDQQQQAFSRPASHISRSSRSWGGGGGGAIDPFSLTILGLGSLAPLALAARRRRQQQTDNRE